MQAFREFAVSFRRQPQQMLPHRKVIYFQIVHFTPSIKNGGEVIVFYANGNCPQTKICKRLNHAGHHARHMKETDRRMPGRFFTSSLEIYIFRLEIQILFRKATFPSHSPAVPQSLRPTEAHSPLPATEKQEMQDFRQKKQRKSFGYSNLSVYLQPYRNKPEQSGNKTTDNTTLCYIQW